MRYVSPAWLFNGNLPATSDRKAIRLRRTQLLADLDLTGSEGVTLKGQSFTKDELIKYFEELQQPNIAAYHWIISEDPVLVEFLQNGAIGQGKHFKLEDRYNDPGFIDWVSPYFHSAFAMLAAQCFELTDAIPLQALLENKLMMTAADQERSWLFIAGILEKNISLFEHYKDRGQRNSPKMMPVTSISAFLGHAYLEVIKQLPNDRFARLKDVYAFNMMHPAIAVFNRDLRNRSIAVIWVQDALELAVSGSVKDRIRRKLYELNGLLKKIERKVERGGRIGSIVGVIVALSIFANIFNEKSDPIIHVTDSRQSVRDSMDTTIAPGDSVIVMGHRHDTSQGPDVHKASGTR